MTLQLKSSLRLHCSVGLMDWDMDKELKLATTTDNFYHDDKLNDHYVVQRPSARASRRKDDFIWYDETSDTFVKPNLWLLVNPNIVCPMQYREPTSAVKCEPAEEIRTSHLDSTEIQHPHAAEFPRFSPLEAQRTSVSSSSKYMIKNEDASRRPAKGRRQGRTSKAMDIVEPGCWPRPPVNYSILIALALKSSLSGSLKVQQIYNFTREHFPFFQTAPDGWKNTIRHNLCFNSSFCKTCNQLYRDGKRKSCFWHLTPDGHRRLKEELHMLTGETVRQLERSMSHPDVIWSLLET